MFIYFGLFVVLLLMLLFAHSSEHFSSIKDNSKDKTKDDTKDSNMVEVRQIPNTSFGQVDVKSFLDLDKARDKLAEDSSYDGQIDRRMIGGKV